MGGHLHNYVHERPFLTYEQIKDMMVSKREPYALWDAEGIDRYKPPRHVEERYQPQHKWWRDIGMRPWEQEDGPVRSGRAPGINPWVLSTSANAPFATYHNEPLQEQTRPMVIAPWEKEEFHPIKSRGFCGGHVSADMLKKVHRLPWALFEDGNRHPKDCRVSDTKYPINQRNEIPWNRRTKPDIPQPPQKPIILMPSSHAAPFATNHNKVVVKYGAGLSSQSNNTKRLYQRCARPFDGETHWPFERDEWDYHSKLPRDPQTFPRDPKTYVPFPTPYAYEHKKVGQKHCDLVQGHVPKHQFYPGKPAKMAAAGDFGRVHYPLKLISYPRQPSTYVPFPVPFAYPPEGMTSS